MAKKKQKFYVVWNGRTPGIYTNWNECLKQVNGFTKPVFKSFESRAIAEQAFKDVPDKYLGDHYVEPGTLGKILNPNSEKIIRKALAVDAACSGNPGPLEYQGVDVGSRKKIFHQGPFPLGTVNIGEFLALVHGLAYLKQKGSDMPIYSDSITAMSWVRKKAIKTNLPRNAKTEELYKLVDRALIWIKSNSWKNPILKWETAEWGEIPADFGRK
jgi:ribonuclease HI